MLEQIKPPMANIPRCHKRAKDRDKAAAKNLAGEGASIAAANHGVGNSLATLRALSERLALGDAPRTWIETCGRPWPVSCL